MPADKDEIRSRSDIVDVVGAAVTLRRRGRNYVGLCPFHQEKTPSFHVDPQTQTFKCFGCGVGGDVFTFIQQYENMSFPEAAEHLARRAGLEFERRGADREKASEREQIYALNALAARWFRDMLGRVQMARDYLYERGLVHETIQRFQLGYAPEGWDNLAGHLQAQRQDLSLAARAGLVHQGRTQDYYDVFRHRIIFPIHDDQERIVGFGGRAFADDQPKYLNTGETPVFSKSRLLYGLPFARREIGAQQKALLMEGYMDVIAAHQAGFANAVATLGTALTEEHARRLIRLAPTVVLVYDADSAGIKATLRASEILEREGIEVRVARLPAGDDPDSLLKRGDTAGFQRAIDAASGRVEYLLDRVIAEADQSTDTGRARLLRQIVHILASIPSRSQRDVYVARVWRHHPSSAHGPAIASEQLHRDAEAVAARLRGEAPSLPAPAPQRDPGYTRRSDRAGREGRRPPRPAPVAPPPANPAAPGAIARAEAELIRALWDPKWRREALRVAHADDFFSDEARWLFQVIAARQADLAREEADLLDVLDQAGRPEYSLAVRARLQEFNAALEKVPLNLAALQDCARVLRRHRLRQLKRSVAQLLQSKPVLDPEDEERLREYYRLIAELQRKDGAAGSQGEQ